MLRSTWIVTALVIQTLMLCVPHTDATSIKGIVEANLNPFASQIITLYSSSSPSALPVTITSVDNSSEAIDRLDQEPFDFSLTTLYPSANYPDIVVYPILSFPLAIVFNLPTSNSVGWYTPICKTCTTLQITGAQICGVFNGTITKWSAIYPAATTQVIIPIVSTGPYTMIITSYCSKLFPSWSSSIGVGNSVNWNQTANFNSSRFNVLPSNSSWQAVSQLVATTPYSISYLSLNEATLKKLYYFSVQNSAALFAYPNASSTLASTYELGGNSSLAPLDLTLSKGVSGYPLVGVVYFSLHRQLIRVDCALKNQIASLLQWITSNPSIAVAANHYSLVMFPAPIVSSLILYNRIQADIMCDATTVFALPLPGSVSGLPDTVFAIQLLIDQYMIDPNSTKTALSFLTSASTSTASYIGIVNNQIDLGLVTTIDWPNTTLSNAYETNGTLLIPAGLTGIAPIFSLPEAIANTATDPTYADLLPLYPIVMDIETLAGIYFGLIISWTDVSILRFNPSLEARFNRTQTRSNITVMTCCDNVNDPLVATSALGSLLYSQSSLAKSFFSSSPVPFPWTRVMWGQPVRTMVNGTLVTTYRNTNKTALFRSSYNEADLVQRVQSIPGSIGYKMIDSASGLVDPTYVIRVLSSQVAATYLTQATGYDVAAAALQSMAPTASVFAMGACLNTDSLSFNSSTLDLNVSSLSPECWPLTSLVSYVIRMKYDNTAALLVQSSQSILPCSRADQTLTMLQYLATSNDRLSNLASSQGMYLIASDPHLSAASLSQIELVTCTSNNGISITASELTTIWAASEASVNAATAIAAIGLVMCAVTAVIVVWKRSDSILRSSTVSFLLIILFGLMLIFLALGAWVQEPTGTSCSLVLWFASLGFTLIFFPLFLKSARIWLIFERKRLKVNQVTTLQLLFVVALMTAIDVIILAVWQSRGGLQPTVLASEDVDRLYCSTDMSVSVPFIVMESLIKGSTLFFGALISFSTRDVVATFNESSCIAWSVYNTIFTSCLVAAAGFLFSPVGDMLIILVIFVLSWISYVTWALIFLPKLAVLYVRHRRGEDGNGESKTSLLSTDDQFEHFGLVQLETLDRSSLIQYMTALNGQLAHAKRLLSSMSTSVAPSPAAGARTNKDEVSKLNVDKSQVTPSRTRNTHDLRSTYTTNGTKKFLFRPSPTTNQVVPTSPVTK